MRCHFEFQRAWPAGPEGYCCAASGFGQGLSGFAWLRPDKRRDKHAACNGGKALDELLVEMDSRPGFAWLRPDKRRGRYIHSGMTD